MHGEGIRTLEGAVIAAVFKFVLSDSGGGRSCPLRIQNSAVTQVFRPPGSGPDRAIRCQTGGQSAQSR